MQPALYMLISALFFSGMGVAIKMLGHLPFYELVLFRSLIILGICVPLIARLNSSLFGKKENRWVLILRGFFGTAGLSLYFWTLQKLDFGTAVTIQYTSPIFTVLIATYFLGEKKSSGVLGWMLLAFFGVATIYRFDVHSEKLWLIAAGLLAAFFSGCAYNCIAQLKNKEHPQVIMIFFPLVTIPIIAIPSMAEFVVPTGKEAIMIASMGVCTYFGQFFLTKAYQSAPATKVAIFGNLNVIMALAVGTLVFKESLDIYKISGAAMIFLSVFSVQVKDSIGQFMKRRQLETYKN